MLFGAKKVEEEDKGIPVSQVLTMKSQGYNNQQIVSYLKSQGYSLTQIRDALTQAEIKGSVAPPIQPMMEQPPEEAVNLEGAESIPEIPPLPDMNLEAVPPIPELEKPTNEIPPLEVPPPPKPPESAPTSTEGVNVEQVVDELQRIIEGIIEDKWKTVEEKLAGLEAWKAKLEEKVKNLSDQVNASNLRIDDLSKSLIGKSESYQKTLEDVNTEMMAVEKIMGKLIPSLSEEIKSLRDIVEKMKK